MWLKLQKRKKLIGMVTDTFCPCASTLGNLFCGFMPQAAAIFWHLWREGDIHELYTFPNSA